MRNIRLSLIALGLAIILGCTPDQYTLNRTGLHMIHGRVMSDLESVEVVADNGLLLRENARTSIRSTLLTQTRADFTLELLKGDGVRISFRTASNDFKNHPSISLDWTTEGCIIRQNDKVVSNIDTVRAEYEQPSRIQIKNDGDYVKISVDCDEILFTRTSLPASEYFVFETLGEASALITGIEIAEVMEGF